MPAVEIIRELDLVRSDRAVGCQQPGNHGPNRAAHGPNRPAADRGIDRVRPLAAACDRVEEVERENTRLRVVVNEAARAALKI